MDKKIKKVDFRIYNKPPYLPSWLSNGDTKKFAETFDENLDEINDEIRLGGELYDPDTLLNNSFLLDRRGNLLGLTRDGDNNEGYYRRQQIKIILNNSKGSVSDLIKLFKLLFPNEELKVSESYPAGITLYHDEQEGVPVDFERYVEQVIGAGINWVFTKTIPNKLEKIKISDDKDPLYIFWDFDEVHYCGKQNYNGLLMYGGQRWYNLFYNGASAYNAESAYNGYQPIRNDLVLSNDSFYLNPPSTAIINLLSPTFGANFKKSDTVTISAETENVSSVDIELRIVLEYYEWTVIASNVPVVNDEVEYTFTFNSLIGDWNAANLIALKVYDHSDSSISAATTFFLVPTITIDPISLSADTQGVISGTSDAGSVGYMGQTTGVKVSYKLHSASTWTALDDNIPIVSHAWQTTATLPEGEYDFKVEDKLFPSVYVTVTATITIPNLVLSITSAVTADTPSNI